MGTASDTRLAEAFAGCEVVVVGDVILDGYLSGHTERLCREAPVPVVTLRAETNVPGGAANVAANLRALGARVTLLSVVGDDAEAAAMRVALAGADVPSQGLVVDPERSTLAKRRLMADGQMVARIDQGTTTHVTGEAERALVERLEGAYARCDAIVVSDYGCGVVTPALVAALSALRGADDRRVMALDAKRPDSHADLRPTFVKPNYGEALALLERAGEPVPLWSADGRAASLAPMAPAFLRSTGADFVVVTLDSEGALVITADEPPQPIPPLAVDHAYPSGAGDTFLAAATLGRVVGASAVEAARLGIVAAGVAVRKTGTAPCSARELHDALAGAEKFEPDASRLADRLRAMREQGMRVVFTNGCFDILHRGHIEYLERARRLGDVLVVGVNDDDSVARIKGPSRPVNTLRERVHVLGALSSVDIVVPFAEDTADSLLAKLRPDVFAKGGDYLRETVPEASVAEALGIELAILPLVEDRSTSGLIERIREASQGGEPR